MSSAEQIKNGKAVIGIEFGSTRIKAVLIGEDHSPLAAGIHDWQNELLEVFCKTEPLLDRDHYRILIGDDGRKYLRPIGYFYYADELEEGDGKPFRGVSFRTCDIPLDEFIDNVKNVEGYAADYQCEIRQYIDDLSAVGLAEAVRASGILSLSILPYDAITMDTPVGDYIA